MTRQSSSKRRTIEWMLNESGMTAEQLYEILFGREQAQDISADIDVSKLSETQMQQAAQRLDVQEDVLLAGQMHRQDPACFELEELEAIIEASVTVNDEGILRILRRYSDIPQGIKAFLQAQHTRKLMQILQSLQLLTPHLKEQLEPLKDTVKGKRMALGHLLEAEITPEALEPFGLQQQGQEVQFYEPLHEAVPAMDDSTLGRVGAFFHSLMQQAGIPELLERVQESLQQQRRGDDNPEKDPYGMAALRQRMAKSRKLSQTAMRDHAREMDEREEEREGREEHIKPKEGYMEAESRNVAEDEREEALEAEQEMMAKLAMAKAEMTLEEEKREHTHTAFRDHDREMAERQDENKERQDIVAQRLQKLAPDMQKALLNIQNLDSKNVSKEDLGKVNAGQSKSEEVIQEQLKRGSQERER